MSNKKVNRMPGFHLFKTRPRDARAIKLYVPEFYWIFIAKNGKTIGRSSEMYRTKRSATKSINVFLSMVDAQDLCLYYDHTPKGKEKEPDLFVIR
jgi:hypothetical protein